MLECSRGRWNVRLGLFVECAKLVMEDTESLLARFSEFTGLEGVTGFVDISDKLLDMDVDDGKVDSW